MFAAMLEDRAMTSSLGARSAFFADKEEALQRYLAELLKSRSAARVREAISVISASRSVTLIDEVLGAGRDESGELRQLLQEMRADLGANGTGSELRGNRRNTALAARTRRKLASLFRTVLPAVRPLGTPAVQIVACVQDQVWSLSNPPRKWTVGASALADHLQWLRFDLLQAIAEPDACSESVERDVAELRGLLGGVVEPGIVSPDGPAWDIPWGVVFPEVPLAISPIARPEEEGLGRLDKVLVVLAHDVNLPSIPLEVQAMQKRFPNARIAQSAKELAQAVAQSWDVIHVAAHAAHNLENPMFSTLQVGTDTVFAAEIAAWRPKAKLVVLSACETGRFSKGDCEPDGLVRAFMAGGARSVIGSGWQVDDRAAARFVEEFYDALSSEDKVSVALVNARKKLRFWKNHPYYWGAWMHFLGYA